MFAVCMIWYFHKNQYLVFRIAASCSVFVFQGLLVHDDRVLKPPLHPNVYRVQKQLALNDGPHRAFLSKSTFWPSTLVGAGMI